MFLSIVVDAFRDHSGAIALLATLSIVYGTAKRTRLPAWLGLCVWALVIGGAALQTGHEAIQAEEVIADGGCIEQGTTTFCHELRHIRTTRTMIPPSLRSSGPPVVTLGFRFEGQRSCRTAKGEVVADFRLTMHGISEPVVADYPDLMARILPSPAELERYRIGDIVGISVGPHSAPAIDPAAMSSALGFDGRLLPNANHGDFVYAITKYVPVAESLAACLAHGS